LNKELERTLKEVVVVLSSYLIGEAMENHKKLKIADVTAHIRGYARIQIGHVNT
jgi:hypothetical protein